MQLSFTFLAFFITQNLQKVLRVDPEIWQHAIFKPKWLICPIWGFFFRKTSNVRFMYPLALFIVQNYKKSVAFSQSYEDEPFPGPKFSCPPYKNFSVAPFTAQSFKKILQQIQSYEDAQFLGPKWPVCLEREFFQKTEFLYWNRTGRQHFWPYLENQIFPTYAVFAEC